MIIIDPVIEVCGASGFTAWPAADLPAGQLLALSGQLSPDGVGTVLAVIATYGDDDPADDAPALIQRMITSECLLAPGGLRVRDTGTGVTVNPGCCCGLENWREWRDVASGSSPWLGHNPAPWIEHLGQAIRVWPDGGLGEPPAGTTPIEAAPELAWPAAWAGRCSRFC